MCLRFFDERHEKTQAWKLKWESRLVFDYEQGADACAELRTGNTPRGETSHVLRTSKDHGDSIAYHIREDRKQQPMRRRKPKFLEQPTFQFEAWS